MSLPLVTLLVDILGITAAPSCTGSLWKLGETADWCAESLDHDQLITTADHGLYVRL